MLRVEPIVYREAAVDGSGGPPAVPPGPSVEDHQRIQTELETERVRAARLQARLDFPLVDAELLEMFKGSPEEIRQFAEKSQAKAEAALATAQQPPAGQPAPVAGEGSPAPVPGVGSSLPPEDANEAEYQRHMDKIRDRTAEPHEVHAIAGSRRPNDFGVALSRAWNQHMNQRKASRGGAA